MISVDLLDAGFSENGNRCAGVLKIGCSEAVSASRRCLMQMVNGCQPDAGLFGG